MSKRQTTMLCVMLAILGCGLILVSAWLGPRVGDSGGLAGLSPRPSPTWALLPTRVPLPTVYTELDYRPFYRALLRGQIPEASQLWSQLRDAAQEETAELYTTGARLALAQGRGEIAEERTWDAIGQAPDDALIWSLLGVVLNRGGDPAQAEQAWGIAQSLDPGLTEDVLPSRWRAALASGDAATIVALAEEFGNRYPDSIFAPYYRAEALLMVGTPSDAIGLLVGALTEEPSAPALLWYTLGRAYLARGGYTEAAISLEAAAYRIATGDTSLELITARPVDDLNAHLGEAYLQTARCAEAETMFRRLMANQPELLGMVEAAVVCQTPTPTLTPWIPVQIGTVTPRP